MGGRMIRSVLLTLAVVAGIGAGIGAARAGLVDFLFPKSVAHVQSVAAKQSLILANYVVYNEVILEERGADVLVRWDTSIDFVLDLKRQPLVFTEETLPDGSARLVVTAPPIGFNPPNPDTTKYRSINLNPSIFIDEDRMAKEFYEGRIKAESINIATALLDKPEVRALVERELTDFVEALTLGLGIRYADFRVEFADTAPASQAGS